MAIKRGNLLDNMEVYTLSSPPSVDRFWMVYGIGRSGPNYRHPTKESAHKEAQRLAEANPDTSFVVLKATKAYHANKPVARQVDLSDPDFQEIDDRPF